MKTLKKDGPKGRESGRGLIYMVDDEPMVLELGSAVLEPLGYTVETFRSAQTALRAFEHAQPAPALLVTDYCMPSMNGLELSNACRQIRPKQKVLLVSGTVGPEIFRDELVQPDGFLAKPYDAQKLIEAVTATLES